MNSSFLSFLNGTRLHRALVFSLSLIAAPLSQAITVNTLFDEDNGDANSDSDHGAGISLREAIKYSSLSIDFAANLNNGTITLRPSLGQLVIGGAFHINASDLTDGITIKAADGHRVFEIQPGHTVTLENLTLTDGSPTGAFPGNAGGAIYNDGATLTLTDCTLSDHQATYGGAIFNKGYSRSVTLSLTNCTLSNNSATEGGAIFSDGRSGAIAGSATLALTDCSLSGNSASTTGGAIFSRGRDPSSISTTTLTTCTLSNNSAYEGGGISSHGVDNGTATLTLTDSTLNDNWTLAGGDSATFPAPQGGLGGGIFNKGDSTLTLTSCSLFGNQTGRGGNLNIDPNSFGFAGSGGDGAGIYNDGTLTLENCTLHDNQTGDGGNRNGAPAGEYGNGGGIFSTSTSTLSLTHCTITENLAFIGGGINNSSSSLTIGNSLIAANIGIQSDPNLKTPTAPTTPDPNLISEADPQLAPLAHYGGPTQTMHPLAGSPAILDTADTTRTDQRGFTLNGPPTIGAVKLGNIIEVSDEGTLRTALSDSANTTGQVIRFASSLDDETITLSANSTQLEVTGTANGLFIDASNLANGLTIDANASDTDHRRVLEIKPNATAALHGLTLTGGKTADGGAGGGIFVADNSSLTLNSSTLSGNITGDGSGLAADGGAGGGIFVDDNSSLTLNFSTLSGNITGSGGSGGGIYSSSNSTFNITNSIIAGNAQADLLATTQSENIAGFATVDPATNILSGDPLLAPLGDYGGPTRTMLPLPNSPARNMATSSTRTADQRGFPITDGQPDIGAAEFREGADFPFILSLLWETDHDGDGSPFAIEFALGTDPFVADPEHLANPALSFNATGHPVYSFGYNLAAVGLLEWQVQRSTDLQDWGSQPVFFSLDPGNPIDLVDDQNPNNQKAFYRFGVAPVQPE